MQKSFSSLRYIGSFLKFSGVVSLILGAITLIVAPLALSEADSLIVRVAYSSASPGAGLLTGLFLGILFFFLFAAVGILLYALGECCKVLVTIEENTRAVSTGPDAIK